MNSGRLFQGSLFAENFLCESIVETPDGHDVDDTALDGLEVSLRDVFTTFPTDRTQ